MATGVSTRYAPKVPGDHPWLGRLAPNLKLTVGKRHTSVAELLRPARPLLIRFGGRELPPVAGTGVDACHADCPALCATGENRTTRAGGRGRSVVAVIEDAITRPT
ncbi:aromatic-ring hydroxylase C-terminal domain-containing protein [Thermocatellispora tengchongensis]|uniref:aromatic-ring hydroxylase C-terminal domain-containing protein n=1 Tax=Thermocatellispora tengchongensis TaxID=1073253 RepID=UPI0035E44071